VNRRAPRSFVHARDCGVNVDRGGIAKKVTISRRTSLGLRRGDEAAGAVFEIRHAMCELEVQNQKIPDGSACRWNRTALDKTAGFRDILSRRRSGLQGPQIPVQKADLHV